MKWREGYSVNHDRMDDQHKRLFEIIQNLEDCMVEGDPLEGFVAVLEELSAYAWAHFKDEENLLKTLAVDNLEAHMAEHHGFKRKIMTVSQTFLKEGRMEEVAEIHSFLVHWLENHILTMDMTYKSP